MSELEGAKEVYQSVMGLLDPWKTEMTNDIFLRYTANALKASGSEHFADIVAGLSTVAMNLGVAIAQAHGADERSYFLQLQEAGPLEARLSNSGEDVEKTVLAGAALVTGCYHYATETISEQDYELLIDAHTQEVSPYTAINSVVSVVAAFMGSLNERSAGAGVLLYESVKQQMKASLEGGENWGDS